MKLSRRQFLKRSVGGAAVLVVGPMIPGVFDNPLFAATPVQTLIFHVTDAIKGMVTDNAINPAKCYFWLFKDDRFPAEVPGPLIFTTVGQQVKFMVTNDLDEPHALAIPALGFTTGSIPPGKTVVKSFKATKAGTYLYYDNLNEPVNRVMGLHGAFVVMPAQPKKGHRFTPYDTPTSEVQQLFDDLGATPWFPGLAWEQDDPATFTVPFRQNVWVLHQASPNLFAEVGSLPAGVLFDPQQFIDAFTKDPFSPVLDNRTPQYFTIDGQSGNFCHDNPVVSPMNRVGEPTLVRILNAGLWTHSDHIHANHVYVISVNGVVQENAIFVDTFPLLPLDTVDWLIPYTRPPDIPNERGIGRADPGLPTLTGGNTWPPTEELELFFPRINERKAKDQNGNDIDLAVEQSPLCFPMHDHAEASQTAQGGNYPNGIIAGVVFIGDRNTPGGVTTFPGMLTDIALATHGPDTTGPAAPPIKVVT